MSYAEKTTVPVEKSKSELKRTIMKYGGSGYEMFETEDKAGVQFKSSDRQIRILVDFPGPEEFTYTPTGRRRRSKDVALKEYEQEQRRRWRALILCMKAKFEIVESGISTFEKEFMPYMVLPDGRTVADHVLPKVTEAYATGQLPKSMIQLQLEDQR